MKSGIGKSVARNFSIMFGAQTITWASSFVLLYFLPRYLGSQEYGRLYLAISIKMMLGLMIDFGGNYLIPKEVARSRETGDKILNSYIILRILLWMLSIGAVLLLSKVLGYSDEVYLLILVLAIGKLWEGWSSAFSSFFQGIERTEYPSLGSIAERIFVALFAVIALIFGAKSLTVAIIMVIGTFLNLLVVLWFARKHVTLSYKFDFKVFKLLRSGLPYFLFSLFSIIYYRVDAVMLSSMTTDSVTGWYGGAYRFFDTVMVLPLIYKTAIFPIFSKLWDDEDGMLQKTMSVSLKLIIILGVPVCLIIFLFSKDIIRFFMGLEEFGPSVILLQIFALSIPIIYVDLIIGSAILGAANRQRAWALTGFIAIFLNIGANYLMIPYTQAIYGNGGIGAAVATFVTEIFMMISALYLLPNDYLKTFRLAYITKPVVAGGVMGAFVWLLYGSGINWIILIALAGGVYLAALFGVKLFNEQELKIIKGAVSIRKLKLMLGSKDIS